MVLRAAARSSWREFRKRAGAGRRCAAAARRRAACRHAGGRRHDAGGGARQSAARLAAHRRGSHFQAAARRIHARRTFAFHRRGRRAAVGLPAVCAKLHGAGLAAGGRYARGSRVRRFPRHAAAAVFQSTSSRVPSASCALRRRRHDDAGGGVAVHRCPRSRYRGGGGDDGSGGLAWRGMARRMWVQNHAAVDIQGRRVASPPAFTSPPPSRPSLSRRRPAHIAVVELRGAVMAAEAMRGGAALPAVARRTTCVCSARRRRHDDASARGRAASCSP